MHRQTQQLEAKWRPATVLDVYGSKVLVHYNGWRHTFDEWIDIAKEGYRVGALMDFSSPDVHGYSSSSSSWLELRSRITSASFRAGPLLDACGSMGDPCVGAVT